MVPEDDTAAGRRLAQLAAEAAGAPTPADALRAVSDLRRELERFERAQVVQALSDGVSFAAIARELGLSRQAVHRRFRRLASVEAPMATAPAVRAVLGRAREAATALGSQELRSEHVLLAVLHQRTLPAAAVLRAEGVTLERVHRQVAAAALRGPLFQRSRQDDGDLYALLAAPVDEARRRGGPRLEVEHLLLGILQDPSSGASRVLEALGVDVEQIRDQLAALVAPNGALPRRGAAAAGG
jgi:ATP-dependent Clp protease ATP-binding subunit ClpA